MVLLAVFFFSSTPAPWLKSCEPEESLSCPSAFPPRPRGSGLNIELVAVTYSPSCLSRRSWPAKSIPTAPIAPISPAAAAAGIIPPASGDPPASSAPPPEAVRFAPAAGPSPSTKGSRPPPAATLRHLPSTILQLTPPSV
jgi:hypothetical protein